MANISPQTVIAYFQSKADSLFTDQPSSLIEHAKKSPKQQRLPAASTLDMLRELVSRLPPPGEASSANR